MKNMKEIFRIGFILFAIAGISALLLAFANKITAPVIEVNNQKKTEESMSVIMPEAADFEKSEYKDEHISEVYIGKDESGNTVGVCVVGSEFGYGGEIKVMTGIDAEGKITGVDILSHSETPGLGAKADNDEFKTQFAGRTAGIAVTKKTPKDNEVSAISGATITSKAVTCAVNDAFTAAESVLKEGK